MITKLVRVSCPDCGYDVSAEDAQRKDGLVRVRSHGYTDPMNDCPASNCLI